MNGWFVAASALLLSAVPLGVVLLRSDTMSRLVAYEVLSVNMSLALVLIAEGNARSSYAELGFVLAVLSVVSGLVYARFLERWL